MDGFAGLLLFPLGCVVAYLASPSFYLEILKRLSLARLKLSKVPWSTHFQQVCTTSAWILDRLSIVGLILFRHSQAACFTLVGHVEAAVTEIWMRSDDCGIATQQLLKDIKHLVDFHETAEALDELVQKDGAGSWPPRVSYERDTWPAAVRPYDRILKDLLPQLATPKASLDDDTNSARIADFRSVFRRLLNEHIILEGVEELLKAAEAGRWDAFPRDTFNAFYCCLAMSRHAYRWGTIPAVKVAQLEQVVDFPPELVTPWTSLQRVFGCTSQSGNNTSCLVLNCDSTGNQAYQINVGLSEKVKSSEQAFVRILHDVEVLGLPIYHDMIRAIISFSRLDREGCVTHLTRINQQLRPLFNSYYSKVHDDVIAISVWLSHVQGFFGWGVGYIDADGAWVKYDGLSGNQSLLFQALDAFLGIEPYLSDEDTIRNVPLRQRKLCDLFRKHSFRAQMEGLEKDDIDMRIKTEFDQIVKRMRV
ncbi:hypothetical protein HJFPF1_08452 [Paramyrothecium foliicola]|nr:hypothetical protein HJFPF1_08452 [Paramyrothecium foliicola]